LRRPGLDSSQQPLSFSLGFHGESPKPTRDMDFRPIRSGPNVGGSGLPFGNLLWILLSVSAAPRVMMQRHCKLKYDQRLILYCLPDKKEN
jgi:hypothetical protein